MREDNFPSTYEEGTHCSLKATISEFRKLHKPKINKQGWMYG